MTLKFKTITKLFKVFSGLIFYHIHYELFFSDIFMAQKSAVADSENQAYVANNIFDSSCLLILQV